MANEATVTAELQIVGSSTNSNENLGYKSTPNQFRATVSGNKGPAPGVVNATQVGVDIDLSALSNPSLFRVRNLSTTYDVELGVWDGTEFYPVLAIWAGEFFVGRLSEYLGRSYGTDTGTGTYDTGAYTLRARSIGGAASISFEAFDK